MSDVVKTIAGELIRRGAPTLGGLLGTAIGGPAGAVVGGIAGKGMEVLAEALGGPVTPESVAGAPPETIAAAEDAARTMAPIWTLEAQRVAAAEAKEMNEGFSSWQLWKGVIQGVVWLGWIAILICALFGGNMGVKTLLPMTELVGTWGSVTMAWLVVYNGGHTIKEVVGAGTFNWKGR